MNIQHLKYAVEVERTGSITQAAEKLYMSQPNLSKAIKELESTLGIAIFKRTSKGIMPTKKGEEFLNYAKNLLAQIEAMESLYNPDTRNTQRFSISVPRASYIAHAFTRFVNTLDTTKEIELNFNESNSMAAINSVMEGEYNMGIIRYQIAHQDYFHSLLEDKGLEAQSILQYHYMALMSKEHPLALRDSFDYDDLDHYIEILHGDLMLPFVAKTHHDETTRSKKRIYIFERGSQFDLLRKVTATYMWVSPMPQELLDCYGLVQKQCEEASEVYEDMLVYPKGYKLTPFDEAFLEKLYEVRDEVMTP